MTNRILEIYKSQGIPITPEIERISAEYEKLLFASTTANQAEGEMSDAEVRELQDQFNLATGKPIISTGYWGPPIESRPRTAEPPTTSPDDKASREWKKTFDEFNQGKGTV